MKKTVHDDEIAHLLNITTPQLAEKLQLHYAIGSNVALISELPIVNKAQSQNEPLLASIYLGNELTYEFDGPLPLNKTLIAPLQPTFDLGRGYAGQIFSNLFTFYDDVEGVVKECTLDQHFLVSSRKPHLYVGFDEKLWSVRQSPFYTSN